MPKQQHSCTHHDANQASGLNVLVPAQKLADVSGRNRATCVQRSRQKEAAVRCAGGDELGDHACHEASQDSPDEALFFLPVDDAI